MDKFVYYLTHVFIALFLLFLLLGDQIGGLIAGVLAFYWHLLYHREWTRRDQKKLAEIAAEKVKKALEVKDNE